MGLIFFDIIFFSIVEKALAHDLCNGQILHSGVFVLQIVAPISIIPCVYSKIFFNGVCFIDKAHNSLMEEVDESFTTPSYLEITLFTLASKIG